MVCTYVSWARLGHAARPEDLGGLNVDARRGRLNIAHILDLLQRYRHI